MMPDRNDPDKEPQEAKKDVPLASSNLPNIYFLIFLFHFVKKIKI